MTYYVATRDLAEIARVFGGSTPHSLSEYYLGGSLVPSRTSHPYTIPSSGAISLYDFLSAYPFSDASLKLNSVAKEETVPAGGWRYGFHSGYGGCAEAAGPFGAINIGQGGGGNTFEALFAYRADSGTADGLTVSIRTGSNLYDTTRDFQVDVNGVTRYSGTAQSDYTYNPCGSYAIRYVQWDVDRSEWTTDWYDLLETAIWFYIAEY